MWGRTIPLQCHLGYSVARNRVVGARPSAPDILQFLASVVTDAGWEWILERVGHDRLGHVSKPRSRLRTVSPWSRSENRNGRQNRHRLSRAVKLMTATGRFRVHE